MDEIFNLKHQKSLEAQILKEEKIYSRYKSFVSRLKGESDQEYVNRLRSESIEYQFVKVGAEYVAFGVSGPIITEHGKFLMIPARVVGGEWGWHYCLVYPDLECLIDREEIFLRTDSGCLIGMAFNDITCDCKEQLSQAIKTCVDNGSGIVIEIPSQDGRGGGDYKMANQRIMDELKINTVEAAQMFYVDGTIDRRTYEECILILKALGFNDRHKFFLGTNNPEKIKPFLKSGFKIEPQPIVAEHLNDIARSGLSAKAKNWGHILRKAT